MYWVDVMSLLLWLTYRSFHQFKCYIVIGCCLWLLVTINLDWYFLSIHLSDALTMCPYLGILLSSNKFRMNSEYISSASI